MKKLILSALLLMCLPVGAKEIKDCHVPHDNWLLWQDDFRKHKKSPSEDLSTLFMTTSGYRKVCRKPEVVDVYYKFLQERITFAYKHQNTKDFYYTLKANDELKHFHQENKDRENPPLHPLVKW